MGLAFKLAQALIESGIVPTASDLLRSVLDLVAVGTVADVAPLLDENRALVTYGLRMLNSSTPRLGLAGLCRHAQVAPGMITAETLAFRVGPRLNAAGRLANARIAYDLLRTQDPDEAERLASQLESLNVQRQQMTAEMLAEMDEALVGQMDLPILVVGRQHWHPGIVGLVAGKLAERYGRPAFVIGGDGSGSARRGAHTSTWSVVAALEACRPLLLAAGGHVAAGGFRLSWGSLEALREGLCAHATAQGLRAPRVDESPPLLIDAELSIDDLTLHTCRDLAQLEPHGHLFPAPALLCRSLQVGSMKPVGTDHLRLVVDTPHGPLSVIGFGLADRVDELAGARSVDLVGTLAENHWMGQTRVQMTIADVAPTNARSRIVANS